MKKLSIIIIAVFVASNAHGQIKSFFQKSEPLKNEVLKSKDACSARESWTGKPAEKRGSTGRWLSAYLSFIRGGISEMSALSEAIQLKRISSLMAEGSSEADFSEYWVGRILFKIKLDFLAHEVMKSVIENGSSRDTLSTAVVNAAWACLGQIERRSPDLKSPNQDRSGRTATEADFRDGMTHAFARRHAPAIKSLEKFLLSAEKETVDRYRDETHMLLGRAYYAKKDWASAIAHLQQVSKSSTRTIDALSDLSWAYLQADRVSETLGIMIQLRVGSMKNTFAPEPLMVAAIAYNELCHYPDSIRMIRTFVSDYGPSFQWLGGNKGFNAIYPEIMKALKAKGAKEGGSKVPAKIISEWLKSTAFLARQAELNELIAQPKQLEILTSAAQAERVKMTRDFMSESQTFIKDLKTTKLKLKPNQDLPREFGFRHRELKKKIRGLARFLRAQKTWKSLQKNYLAKIPGYRTLLVAKINSDLKKRNDTLLTRLEEIRENMNLIEIEIFHGASQDLIWKGAHEDFDPSKLETEEKTAEEASKTWSWGKITAAEMENAEVWDDEIGSVQAELDDRCKQKEKYLNIKIQKGAL